MNIRKQFIFINIVLVFICGISQAQKKLDNFPVLKGPYLGQKPPGMEPEIFAPGIISTEKSEINSVFSPDGNEFYFSRWDPSKKIHIIMSMKRVNKKNGSVIFTDMFGGTPSNLSFSFLKDNQVEIITGVNLPMLIKFVSLQRSNNLKQVARKVVEQGKKNIHLASAILSSKPK